MFLSTSNAPGYASAQRAYDAQLPKWVDAPDEPEFSKQDTVRMMRDWTELDAHQFSQLASDWLDSSMCGEEDVMHELICAYVRDASKLPEALAQKIWRYCDNLAFIIWKDEHL